MYGTKKDSDTFCSLSVYEYPTVPAAFVGKNSLSALKCPSVFVGNQWAAFVLSPRPGSWTQSVGLRANATLS